MEIGECMWASESGVSILIRTRFPLDADTCPTWYLFVSKQCKGPLSSAQFWGPRLLIPYNINFWQRMRVNTLCLNLGWVVDQLWSMCRDTKCFSLDNVSSSLQNTCGSEAGLKTSKNNPFNLTEPCLSRRAFSAASSNDLSISESSGWDGSFFSSACQSALVGGFCPSVCTREVN